MGKRFVQGKRVFIFLLVLLSVLSFLVITSRNVYATEFGGGAYPNGAEDFMSGAVPPPGYYFINYFLYYSADKFKGHDGNKDNPDFDLKVTANTFRFIYITKQQIFGGYWGVHLFVPLVNEEVTLAPSVSQGRAGLGDIIVDPFILSWHFKNWHLATGVDIYIPTGRYDKDDFANIGRNYWTFEPIFAFTYQSDGGFEVSSKFMYDINTENKDSFFGGDYQSGQEFHFDYTVGYKIDNWRLGVGGYYYKQFTNDELNDKKFGDDGSKGQAIAVGPQVQYAYKNMSFALKYQFETAVENKPEGQKAWFKFVYAF
jgi:hypothetical protein